jgi:hypothetical protein
VLDCRPADLGSIPISGVVISLFAIVSRLFVTCPSHTRKYFSANIDGSSVRLATHLNLVLWFMIS